MCALPANHLEGIHSSVLSINLNDLWTMVLGFLLIIKFVTKNNNPITHDAFSGGGAVQHDLPFPALA